jgi:tetratricopeptide (TPR) repeat protein
MKYLLSFIILLFLVFNFNALALDRNQIWILYLKGNYNQAELLINDSLLEDKYFEPELYYMKAQILMKRGKFNEARNFCDKLLQTSNKWREYGLMGLGDSYFLEGKFKKAESIYQTFLKRFPESNFMPFVLYKLASVLRKQGKWEKSKSYFRKLIQNFPKSIMASQSRRILADNEFYFTLQVGAFLNSDNAYELANKLRKLGFNSEIKEFSKKGRIYYRVRVGRYDTIDEADKELKKLLNRGFTPYIYP